MRLSNVVAYAPDSENFLSAVLGQARRERKVTLRSDPASSKDYIALEDVLELLPRIAEAGRHRLHNVASGTKVTAGELLDAVRARWGTPWSAERGRPSVTFPPISNERIRSEFGFVPTPWREALAGVMQSYENGEGAKS